MLREREKRVTPGKMPVILSTTHQIRKKEKDMKIGELSGKMKRAEGGEQERGINMFRINYTHV